VSNPIPPLILSDELKKGFKPDKYFGGFRKFITNDALEALNRCCVTIHPPYRTTLQDFLRPALCGQLPDGDLVTLCYGIEAFLDDNDCQDELNSPEIVIYLSSVYLFGQMAQPSGTRSESVAVRRYLEAACGLGRDAENLGAVRFLDWLLFQNPMHHHAHWPFVAVGIVVLHQYFDSKHSKVGVECLAWLESECDSDKESCFESGCEDRRQHWPQLIDMFLNDAPSISSRLRLLLSTETI